MKCRPLLLFCSGLPQICRGRAMISVLFRQIGTLVDIGFGAVGLDLANDSAVVAGRVEGHEVDGCADAFEGDGAVPHFWRNTDQRGLCDRIGLHVIRIFTQLELDLSVEIKEIADVGAGKDQIFLYGMVHVKLAHRALLLNDIVEIPKIGLFHLAPASEPGSWAEEVWIVVVFGLKFIYELVEVAGARQLGHFMKWSEAIIRNCFAFIDLIGSFLHPFCAALATENTFLGAVQHALADAGAIVSKFLAAFLVDATVDLGPVAVKIDRRENDGLCNASEMDGAVIEFGRNADDGRFGEGKQFHPLGVVAQPDVNFRVKLKEVVHVGTRKDQILVNGVMCMRNLHYEIVRYCTEVHVETGLGHHRGPAKEAARRCESKMTVYFLWDCKNQIVIFSHVCISF